MIKRIFWFLMGVLAFVALAKADSDNGWTVKLGRTWNRQEPELRIFCDGPHRVYVLLLETVQQSPSVVVLKDGCRDWPKQPAEEVK